MSYPKPSDAYPVIHDVIIIGAGPCGLAVAARLCERTPSALFTDDEHDRYHWIRKHSEKVAIKDRKTGNVRLSARHYHHYSTLVLDGSGNDWMARWNRFFDVFQISHLRSPMFFHPDPENRDGLLAYTYAKGRDRELIEIPGCIGKELSKHRKKKRMNCRCHAPKEINERERRDYFTPSRQLFRDFCECIVDRYGLRGDMVKQENVLGIDYGILPEYEGKFFTVRTNQQVHLSRTVVLAVGPGNAPCIPRSLTSGLAEGACHAMHIQQFPHPSVKEKMNSGKATSVLVVGGGLTSAQVTDMAIRSGSKVWHVMRSRLKVKPFDIDLNWMGKFQNFEKAVFWSADTDTERLEKIKLARGGGSLTPIFNRILQSHIVAGNLSLHTHTTISKMTYDPKATMWSVEVDPPAELPSFDYVYFATGIQSDFESLPFLQTIQSRFPIESFEGFPGLNDDLMWRDDVPLFVTGRLAALRLGPAAPNLEGARVGAERISWAIEDFLGREQDSNESSDETINNADELGFRYASGIGSRFESLTIAE